MDKIKSKIQKLLQLSASSNPNEAKSALEKARKLMEETGISEFELKEYVSEKVKATKRHSRHRSIIANCVADLYGVVAVHNVSGFYHFYGEKLYSFMAKEMYLYLTKSIETSIKTNVRKRAKAKYRNHYRISMACAISQRIETLGQQVSWAPELPERKEHALQFFKNEVSDFETFKPKSMKLSSNARLKGFVAGNNVSLNRQTTGAGGRYIGV